MNRDEKAAVVDEIADQLGSAEAVYAVDYRGITVAQIAELRARLRDADTTFRIVKNSLTELAADKAGATDLKPMLEGPTALALVRGDAAVAAKALSDMARQLHILEFKGGLLNGGALSAADVQSIARLPSRDVLNAQLVGTIAAPITGLVRTLNALIAGLAIQLQAIADLDPPALVPGEPPAAQPAPEAAPEAEAEPEPEAEEAAPEPEAEEPAAEPEAAPEPEAEEPATEPEPAAEPEAEAAPEPEAEEPAAEPEAEEPAAEPEAEEPAAEAEPAPEAEESAAEPEAEAVPEPEGEAETAETEPEQDAAPDADESDA
jgi:large subunit ribosomal protein L10